MPVTEERIRPARVVVTALVSLMFAITQLPDVIEKARPELLLLLVIYWSLSAPRIAGLTFAWVCGLALDLLTGPILGQHALAFLLVAFLTHKFQLRMRVFPIWHQTLTVFMLLALYEFIVFWIDGIIRRENEAADLLLLMTNLFNRNLNLFFESDGSYDKTFWVKYFLSSRFFRGKDHRLVQDATRELADRISQLSKQSPARERRYREFAALFSKYVNTIEGANR